MQCGSYAVGLDYFGVSMTPPSLIGTVLYQESLDLMRNLFRTSLHPAFRLAFLLLVACDNSLAPSPQSPLVQVKTLADVVTISGTNATGLQFSVQVSVTNTADRTLYYFSDCGQYLEKGENNRWFGIAYNCADALSAIPIEPLASVTLTIVQSPTPDFPNLTGTYRARVLLYFDTAGKIALPENAGFSNAFSVVD
jgi:hypothetical protein